MSETINGAAPEPAATAKAKKPPKKPRAPRKAKLDPDRLERLAGEIEEYRHGGGMTNLLTELLADEGAVFNDAPGGGTRVALAGITASSTAGVHGAVMNWANAARRAVLKGGA